MKGLKCIVREGCGLELWSQDFGAFRVWAVAIKGGFAVQVIYRLWDFRRTFVAVDVSEVP